jgi:hypothetical protein
VGFSKVLYVTSYQQVFFKRHLDTFFRLELAVKTQTNTCVKVVVGLFFRNRVTFAALVDFGIAVAAYDSPSVCVNHYIGVVEFGAHKTRVLVF